MHWGLKKVLLVGTFVGSVIPPSDGQKFVSGLKNGVTPSFKRNLPGQ
jgi:hypothetical protein